MPDYLVDDAGCWVWQKAQLNGYPTCSRGRAHRVYWEDANGPIPEGWHIHHVCRNTLCVNPDHLEARDDREHRLEHQLERSGLTLDDIREIRRLGRTHGARAPEVAKQFGIGVSNVYWYWTGESWADMDAEGGEPLFPEPWPCLREDCTRTVTGRRDKKFCSATCRGVHNARMARRRAVA